MKELFQRLKIEEGVTLVELLAAITILSIIVTAFLAFFVQAGKTNHMTTEVNEATFIAQGRMEEITHLSTKQSATVGETTVSMNGYDVTTKIAEVEGSDLYKVIVEVKEGGKTRAKMETRLPFAEDPNP